VKVIEPVEVSAPYDVAQVLLAATAWGWEACIAADGPVTVVSVANADCAVVMGWAADGDFLGAQCDAPVREFSDVAAVVRFMGGIG
jgi:hypothetical protein